MVPLRQALGRILARSILADRDIPASDLSAVDGYALRGSDVHESLHILETIPAGVRPGQSVGPGQCSRIMTGALLPPGADKVAMFEHCHNDGDTVRIRVMDQKSNIRYRGEDRRCGEPLLAARMRITPAEMAVLASAGQVVVPVLRKPRVAVIATGDELREPGEPVEDWQIRNSNNHQAVAQLDQMGAEPIDMGIVRDEVNALRNAFEKALDQSDVVLFSGGVSMGDFDYIPQVLKDMGVDVVFEKIRVKPGKPTVFGIQGQKTIFGLPGNPVSAFAIFEWFVKPHIRARMGLPPREGHLLLPLAEGLERKNSGVTEIRPVRWSQGQGLELVEYHGSGHIHSYTQAHGMLMIPQDIARMAKGERVEVLMLDKEV